MNAEMFQTTIDTTVVDDKLSSARCSLKFKTLDNNAIKHAAGDPHFSLTIDNICVGLVFLQLFSSAHD
jgi:hypothetical protein